MSIRPREGRGDPPSPDGSVSVMSERRCLLAVHAHPDDEASKGAGTIARYQAQGVRTVLVCCTGGEEGEVLNPALDTPDTRRRIEEIRMAELAEADLDHRVRRSGAARLSRLGDARVTG